METALEAVRLARPSGWADALALGSRTAAVVADLLLTHTPTSALSGTPAPQKRVVWTQPVPLAELKAVGRLAGATLNDVLMSAVAGALEHYQRQHGREPVDLVTMVPVNVRPLDEPLPPELGNRFALVFFGFPSATFAPLARLAETKRRMDWLKQSPEAALTLGIINVLGLTTTGLERRLVDYFANKAIGVTTNVAGPAAALPRRRRHDGGSGLGARVGQPHRGVHLHVCRDRPGRLHAGRRSRPRPGVTAGRLRAGGRDSHVDRHHWRAERRCGSPRATRRWACR